MSASDFSLLHTKLDRIIAGQDQALAGQAEINATIGALTVAMRGMSDTLDVHRELLVKLAEAMSAEADTSEMGDLIASIEHSLKLIHADGQRMVTMLGALQSGGFVLVEDPKS